MSFLNNNSNDPFATNLGDITSNSNNNIFADTGFGLSQGPQFDMSARGLGSRTSDFSTGAIKSVRVTSCNFTEMVEQANMGFRPFVSKVNDGNVLEMLPGFVREQRLGANFRSETLNPIVNDIVGLSSNILGSVPVVNGWNIRRYSFTIMTEVERSNGNVQMYMIEGFTDTPEIIARGQDVYVDPEMVLYVNNVVSFGQRRNNHTGAMSMVPVENYNVINKDSFAQGTQLSGLVTQRPYDVANLSLQGILGGNSSQLMFDTRSTMATESKVSSLSNNNPATYVAKIINDGINALDNSNTDSLFNSTTMTNMIDRVKEPTLANNGFLQQLGRISHDFPTSVSSFTWKDLTVLDPQLTHSCPYLNLFPASERGIFLPSSGLACDDITGSGNEQMFASMIANGVSDLLSRCKASQVSLMATNHSGVDEVQVQGLECYDQSEVTIQAPIFEQLFIANVLQLINHNTKFAYNIAVFASLWGETYVKVNLGYGLNTFLFPNFANGTYSPVLTNQRVNTENLSRHLLSIANTINTEQYTVRDNSRTNSVI